MPDISLPSIEQVVQSRAETDIYISILSEYPNNKIYPDSNLKDIRIL